MGNAVDVFAPADETLAACDNQSGARYNRYDAYYTIGGTQSAESEDRSFNGTSSACPIAAGLIAAKIQYNRNWGWSDVKAWFRESNKEQSSDDFYLGTETTSLIGLIMLIYMEHHQQLFGILCLLVRHGTLENQFKLEK